MKAKFRLGSYSLIMFSFVILSVPVVVTLTAAESSVPTTTSGQETTQATAGSAAVYVDALKNNVTVMRSASNGGERLTVQYAVVAVCQSAGVPYQWEKSQELASYGARTFIDPINIKDQPADKSIETILAPIIGLAYAVDDNGVYLRMKTAEEYQTSLQKEISAKLDKNPNGERLTVQYAMIAVCQSAGVPYQREKSQELASYGAWTFIDPINIKDQPADKSIETILAPIIGLAYAVDDNGVYLRMKTAEEYQTSLQKEISAKLDKSPDGERLTVQYAAIAICTSAGVPYQWEKSQKLAGEYTRRFIRPINFNKVTAGKALASLLAQLGLTYGVDDNGVYLQKPEKK